MSVHDDKEVEFERLLGEARGLAQGDIEERVASADVFEVPSEDPTSDALLSRYLDGVNGSVEADIDARIARGLPAPPAMPRPAVSSPRWAWVAAAAVVVALLGWGLISATQLGRRDDPELGQAAERVHVDGSSQHKAESRAPTPARASRPRIKQEAAPATEPELEPEAEPEVEPRPEPEVEPVLEPSKPRSLKERLATLDATARKAWRDQDLAGAERAFRRIVRLGGRGSEAERAFAELFSLVQQRRGTAARDEVWRAYLKRFPSGRYADDVRGGLCAGTRGDASAACWGAYLQDFPRGSHRVQAKRALGRQSQETSP